MLVQTVSCDNAKVKDEASAAAAAPEKATKYPKVDSKAVRFNNKRFQQMRRVKPMILVLCV
jgi:hypothetical protein